MDCFSTLEAYNHQDVPFQYLFDRVKNIPKFQVLILLRNSTLAQSFNLTGLEVEDLAIDLDLTRMELNLDITDDGKSPMTGKLEYKTDLFDVLVIRQIIKNFQALLAYVIENPDRKVNEISLPEEIDNSQCQDTVRRSSDRLGEVTVDRDRAVTETQKRHQKTIFCRSQASTREPNVLQSRTL